MKLIIAALALVAAVAALPPQLPTKDSEVYVVESQFIPNPDGSYIHSYKLSDGTEREEIGQLKEVLGEDGKPHIVIVTQGSYSYRDTNGETEKITYVGDENGYHPEGKSIPRD